MVSLEHLWNSLLEPSQQRKENVPWKAVDRSPNSPGPETCGVQQSGVCPSAEWGQASDASL